METLCDYLLEILNDKFVFFCLSALELVFVFLRFSHEKIRKDPIHLNQRLCVFDSFGVETTSWLLRMELDSIERKSFALDNSDVFPPLFIN